MSKVVLTKEQAEAIKQIKDIDYAINIHAFNKRPDSPLAELQTSEIARALYIGYEVEPEFKVGDWVVNTSNGYIKLIESERQANFLNNDYIKHHELRHATSEEIKQEKERRWWKKHGREVWELKDGDVLISKKTDKVYEVVRDFSDIIRLNTSIYFIDAIKQDFKVACFAEQRLDKEDTQ